MQIKQFIAALTFIIKVGLDKSKCTSSISITWIERKTDERGIQHYTNLGDFFGN